MLNLTRVLVVSFIIILLFAAGNAWATDGAKIALGHTAFNSHETVGEVGYEHANWEVNLGLIGAESDDKTVLTYGVSKIVRPNWCVLGGCNYYRIGIAGIDDSPLVGPYNFRLGVGMNWRVFSVEYFHYSSAGIYDPNRGIDGIILKLNIPLEF